MSNVNFKPTLFNPSLSAESKSNEMALLYADGVKHKPKSSQFTPTFLLPDVEVTCS